MDVYYTYIYICRCPIITVGFTYRYLYFWVSPFKIISSVLQPNEVWLAWFLRAAHLRHRCGGAARPYWAASLELNVPEFRNWPIRNRKSHWRRIGGCHVPNQHLCFWYFNRQNPNHEGVLQRVIKGSLVGSSQHRSSKGDWKRQSRSFFSLLMVWSLGRTNLSSSWTCSPQGFGFGFQCDVFWKRMLSFIVMLLNSFHILNILKHCAATWSFIPYRNW